MRREHFQTHFMRYQNQIKTLQGKKKKENRPIYLMKKKYKNSQQNISKPNLAIYKEDHTP